MVQDTFHNSQELDELDWIRVRNELYENEKIETFKEKLKRKMIENPAVPIGIVATVSALCYGLWSSYNGNRLMSQYMMRARVGAQGFTFLSMVIGFILVANKQNHN